MASGVSSTGPSPNQSDQRSSLGASSPAIHAAALAASEPSDGLSWIDIGCGTGTLLRAIRDSCRPARLVGVDLVDWLADDLRNDVSLLCEPAEDAVRKLEPADRVLLVEVLDDLESPWTVLRRAAALVSAGGRIVITTPNLANLRHRVELLVRGRLTSFRPDDVAQRTPTFPHVIERILSEEGLSVSDRGYAAADVIPFTGGRTWPDAVQRRAPSLASVSVVLAAQSPARAGG
jgi:precorrin-6B methylase 2